MGDDNPYPVFQHGLAADMMKQQAQRGGGGGPSGFSWALIGIAVVVGSLFVIAPLVKDCADRRDHEAGEVRQREDARCAQDPWGPDCTAAARERVQSRQREHVCQDEARKRQAWIDATSPELDGYAPTMFHMTAIGDCATKLRVREDDCSLVHLGGAYGSKPFMLTARSLGFRVVSCGYDEFDIADVMRAGG